MSVLKTYRYDWNTALKYSMNYHNYQYIYIPSGSRCKGYDEYKIGGGWNYNRYKVVNNHLEPFLQLSGGWNYNRYKVVNHYSGNY